MKFGLLITFLGIFSLQLFAQPGGQEKPKIGIVSGKVVDAKDNSPMVGVSIKAKNATANTLTQADGSFRLAVPERS